VEAPQPAVEQPLLSLDAPAGQPRGWVGFEYLTWWITRGPVAAPLVTTGNPASPTAGALNDASTHVLFANSGIDFGAMPGGRLSAGYWIDCDATCGLEASGFVLAKQTKSFNAASDASGNPLLGIPFETASGVPSVYLISSPAVPQTGSVSAVATSQLWGFDCLAAWNLHRDCTCSLDVLAGFRYFDLNENLVLSASTSANPTPTTVNAGDFRLQTTTTSQGSGFNALGTRNQFYGGEIGARAGYHEGCWSAEILALLALGSTEQTLNTAGSLTTTTTTTKALVTRGPPSRVIRSMTTTTTTTTAGDVFLNSNSIGHFEDSSFSVIPQVGVKLGYDVTSHIRATVGYDVLFWDNVERPGNQISGVSGQGPLHNLSSLWAQGVSVGLELHW